MKGRRALIFTIVCAGVLALGVVVNIIFNLVTDAELARRQDSLNQYLEEADIQIKETTAERLAREEARKKAAHELAERAAVGNISTEGIDSTVCAATRHHIDPDKLDVVVNKQHCIQPLSYEPSDLAVSNGAKLRRVAIDAFNEMYLAAQVAGQGFTVTSSYRSYADQVATYSYWVNLSGREEADTYSARPGYSEHQTGLSIDVAAPGCMLDCFGTSTQYQWLQQHAADYGFVQRYYAGYESITGYKAEEWHYRYVGREVAQDMKRKGIKTLEEYWNIPGGDY